MLKAKSWSSFRRGPNRKGSRRSNGRHTTSAVRPYTPSRRSGSSPAVRTDLLDNSHSASSKNQSALDRSCCAATERKLTDRTLHVEFDPGHLGEKVDIIGADRTSAQPHIGRHHVQRLDQYADVFQDERVGN